MKPKGRHPHNRLNDKAVKAAGAGYHADGGGLYLVVDKSGARRWALRTTIRGKRRELGLGGYPLVPLAEARDEALKMRRVARKGEDPIAERQKRRNGVPTFAEAAYEVHAKNLKAWKNGKHTAQWISTLEQYAFPVIGNRCLHDIDTPDILKILSPIWLEKPETARRVRQRIGLVMSWAKAAGHRSGDNPVDDVTRGLPKQPDRDKHHAALPYADVPQFLSNLSDTDVGLSVKLAFEFLILTATRTSEVLNAKRSEFDKDKALWAIPGERMKSGRPHRVPLSERCLEIVGEAEHFSDGSPFLFPGAKVGNPLSNMVLLMTLRRMGIEVTAHGFRSSFRDWSAERTNFPNLVCEQALAHVIKDKSEAAYRRTDLLDKRRKLMDAWAAYATSTNAEVVQLRGRGGAS